MKSAVSFPCEVNAAQEPHYVMTISVAVSELSAEMHSGDLWRRGHRHGGSHADHRSSASPQPTRNDLGNLNLVPSCTRGAGPLS